MEARKPLHSRDPEEDARRERMAETLRAIEEVRGEMDRILAAAHARLRLVNSAGGDGSPVRAAQGFPTIIASKPGRVLHQH